MNLDDYLEDLELAFRRERERANEFCARHNAGLPSGACPQCGEPRHLPGIACSRCRYRHPVPWAIIRDTEHGYDVVNLTNSRKVLASFTVEM